MASDIGPGTLVECIRDDWRVPHSMGHVTCPVAGKVYSVRAVIPPRINGGDGDGLLLDEIHNRPVAWIGGRTEPSFSVDYFRPVRDDSLDIFRQAIKDAPVGKERETVG